MRGASVNAFPFDGNRTRHTLIALIGFGTSPSRCLGPVTGSHGKTVTANVSRDSTSQ